MAMNAVDRADRKLRDLDRYMQLRSGATTVHRLADLEGIDPIEIEQSVQRGARQYEAQQQMFLRDAKYRGAIENEQIRSSLRTLAGKMQEAILLLLSGKRSVVETDKVTGKVTVIDVVDPDVIVRGVEAFRKAISLEEKAGPNTLINVQQNNAEGGGEIRVGMTYEERLDEIQKAQSRQALPASRQIIEAEVVQPVVADAAVADTEELF
jgi:hypothetical protein